MKNATRDTRRPFPVCHGIFIVALGLLGATLLPARGVSAEANLNAIYEAADAKDWDRALGLLEDALGADATDLELRRLYAQVSSWAGRYEQAIAAYEALLEDEGAVPALQRELALVETWRGRCDRAVPQLEALLRNDPENSEVLAGLATCLAAMRDYPAAEQAIATLERVAPGHEALPGLRRSLANVRRLSLELEAKFLRDSEGYQALESSLGFGFPIGGALRLTPWLGHGYYESKDRHAQGLKAGLRLAVSALGPLSLRFGLGVEHYVQQATEAQGEMSYGGILGEFGATLRATSALSFTLSALYQEAAAEWQTLAWSPDTYKDMRIGLSTYWTVSPRVEVSLGAFYDSYWQEQELGRQRLSAYGSLLVDLVATRWLFLGYETYATGYDEAAPEFWSPILYMGHMGVLGSRLLRWGDEEGLTARVSAGLASEDTLGDGLEHGAALAGRLDLLVLARDPWRLGLRGRYSRSIRGGFVYQVAAASLQFTVFF